MSYSLHMGDCLEVMPQIPSGSVDMILADLPYGTTACKWDTIIPLVPLWAQYKRIIKRNGAIVLTASQPFTTTLIASNLPMFRYTWVWDKALHGNHGLAKYQPLKVTEDICVFSLERHSYYPQMVKGRPRWKGTDKTRDIAVTSGIKDGLRYWSDDYYPKNILYFPNTDRAPDSHNTQKPVALMEYLIRTYTNEGETVLDNTMGSGTTGVACANTGRQFIGIERDSGYFDIASKRIEVAYSQARQMEMEVTA